MAKKEEEERILILCVDRDGDIEVKAEIKTPVIGRDENLKAAVALALKDPEEPDANAMFEAIRVYDRLNEKRKPNEKFEVATISGSELGGVGADRKLVSELNDTLKKFAANEIILVTDGYSDEAILPLIESRVPVTSVRRIIIKHSKSIEETAALFTRYLKILIENPRYSRIILGLPGLLLIILGILSIVGYLLYYWIAFLLVFGGFLLMKGFGVDKAARKFYNWAKEYTPPPLPVQIASFATAAGTLSIAIGCYQGVNHAVTNPQSLPQNLGQFLSMLPELIGWFISGGIALIVIGVCVVLSGRAIRWYFEHDPKVLRTAMFIAVAAWSWQIFDQASQILINPASEWTGLFFAIFIGILVAIASILVTFLIHRKYADFFKERAKYVEEFEKS